MKKKEISSTFLFESNFIAIKESNIHYIDIGKGDPVLFLHGNPTSSYLWRNIIPYLAPHARCIAPDLIGMGKSGKPQLKYGFSDTYEYLVEFIQQLGLKNITIVVHDWGSALGFHYANTHRNNVKGIAFMEAMYKTLDWSRLPERLKVGITLMRTPLFNWLMIGVGNFFIRKVIPKGTIRQLSREEYNKYASSYPTLRSRIPIRTWPKEIPLKGKPKQIDAIVSSYHDWLQQTEIPKICFYADPGILIPIEETTWIKANFPNTTMVHIGKGLHFIQEDNPHQIGEELKKWYCQI